MQVKINGKKYDTNKDETIINVCDRVGIEIPRFCYHKQLKIAGNCRMCLVEVAGTGKLVPSCVQKVSDGMEIHTQSDRVKTTREGVMSMLLINHPLDCPICDQGGECSLQDQAVKYGKNYSNYSEEKRAVQDKDFGPLIATKMTRCIHCTRCIRFLEDVAGSYEIGAIGRGESMEIDTYIMNGINSEISGNIIDLCPVGALTSKPTAFKARSWELQSTETIDITDATGSNIVIDSKNDEVIRIRPLCNTKINQEWISDKTRFSSDSLKYQRIDQSFIRNASGKLEAVNIDTAIQEAANVIKQSFNQVGAISGSYTDAETMVMAKKILHQCGSNKHCTTAPFIHSDIHHFNTQIAQIEESDHCLLIGCNPRLEAPIVNTRLHKACKTGSMKVFYIGREMQINYQTTQLSSNSTVLQEILNKTHWYWKEISSAMKPIIIIGAGVSTSRNKDAIIRSAHTISLNCNMMHKDWNGLNIMPADAAAVGAHRLQFASKYIPQNIFEQSQAVLMLGADDPKMEQALQQYKGKTIYIGCHGDISAKYADIIIPGASFAEKNATYLNLEGRVQQTKRAVTVPGDGLPDYEILAKIEQILYRHNNAASLQEIRQQHSLFDNAMLNQIHKLNMIPNNTIYHPDHINFAPMQNNRNDLQYQFDSDVEHYSSGTMGRLSPTMQKRALSLKL